MTSKILAALLLSGTLASADNPAAPARDSIDAAHASEHDAAARERYHAQLTTIAERDIVTAQITLDMALRQWELAIQAHREDDARGWAMRCAGALRDERDAQARARHYARERDRARSDFEASADQIRRLERRASR
jgi:hypothetical protein